jgi:dsRNA-specific ribonuclease
MKQNVVCNKSLALLALKLGLHEYMIICDSAVTKRCRYYCDQLDRYYQSPEDLADTDTLGSRAIKLLADCFEAMVGAILVDLELDTGSARRVVLPLLLPDLDHFTSEDQLDKCYSIKLIKIAKNMNF